MTTTERTDKTPYDAAHVSIVREAGRITALYIPDPEQAKTPKLVLDNVLDRSLYEDVEIVAVASRHYKRDGSDFSGWIVTSGPNSYTDPISRKADAEDALKGAITLYFTDRRPYTDEQPAQDEVTRSLELEVDDEVWDEPRSELTEAEVFGLRAGLVVEAKTVQGSRCRLRLAAAPTTAHTGTAFLEGPKAELYEVTLDSVTLIGVLPRKGDTVHAQAKSTLNGVVGRSPVMRRKLDRDPWPGGPGNLVISDGRGVDAVLTSSIVILAEAPAKRTDEQRIARAVSLAMPGLDFHTNTTSTTSIRLYAKRAEHEGRDDEAVLARNDDIAEAIALAGYYVARRGAGQAVYAQIDRSSHAANDGRCERPGHRGEPALWIAVLPGAMPLESEYACRACVTRYVEQQRAEAHVDPERPYIVRMWDRAGRTLRVAPDCSSLDFLGAASEYDARRIARGLTERGWLTPVQGGDPVQVPIETITIDRADFETNGRLWKLRRIAERPAGDPFVKGRRCSVGSCIADATRVHHWIDRGYAEPAPKAEAKCLEHGQRGVKALGGHLAELTEARA